MVYQLSPGVNWTEYDLTTIVPSVSTTEGAFVGNFAWGPVGEARLIADEVELVRYFNRPNDTNFKDFYTAANFLGYAQALRVVRANTESVNATSGTEVVKINNQDVYELDYLDLSANANVGVFAARYPGTLGNGLLVSYCASANTVLYPDWVYGTLELHSEFQTNPSTSKYVADRGGANDEMHVIVIDQFGKFTGIANSVLEKFAFVSKAVDAKNDDGSSKYYVNVINDQSQYIYIMNHPSDASNWGSTANGTSFSAANANTFLLSGGTTVAPTDANLTEGYDLFANPEESDVSLIMTGAHSKTVCEYVADNIVGGSAGNEINGRRDAVAFMSPAYADVVDNPGMEANDIVDYFANPSTGLNSSSYVFIDCNWKKQFDKYNNTYRWVPLNGDIAGLCARTDFERDPWWSPAGFNRGHIKNVVKLAWNPNKAERDTLYKNGINPVVGFKGEGVVLYGDKTFLAKPSSFDRINVRRLFIVLEKAISKAAKYSLFEFNDEFTRAQFVALVEPYLRDVKGRRGIYDFKVVCDETNNTPEIIDRNEFVGDIYIKPARSINFIQLNFIAVRTGVAFSEIVGKY